MINYKNGDKYEGNYNEDLKEGYGQYIGRHYEYAGDYVNDLKHGYGVEKV